MRRLTFIKKGRVEWMEVPEPQLTDSLQDLAQIVSQWSGRRP